jgi:hypothetical protein
LAVVKLDDVFYTYDYFKVKISCSKTDLHLWVYLNHPKI